MEVFESIEEKLKTKIADLENQLVMKFTSYETYTARFHHLMGLRMALEMVVDLRKNGDEDEDF